jgi:hypothetical protein
MPTIASRIGRAGATPMKILERTIAAVALQDEANAAAARANDLVLVGLGVPARRRPLTDNGCAHWQVMRRTGKRFGLIPHF